MMTTSPSCSGTNEIQLDILTLKTNSDQNKSIQSGQGFALKQFAPTKIINFRVRLEATLCEPIRTNIT